LLWHDLDRPHDLTCSRVAASISTSTTTGSQGALGAVGAGRAVIGSAAGVGVVGQPQQAGCVAGRGLGVTLDCAVPDEGDVFDG
jgi:hypothetical protein